MSILGQIFTKGKKGLTGLGLEEIRVEEKRLEIRENQHLRQIEKYDKLPEEVFHQGAKNKSPARRRIYARRFVDRTHRFGPRHAIPAGRLGLSPVIELGIGQGADGRMAMTKVTLCPQVTWGGEAPSAEVIAELHHKAHEACFIANSVNTEVTIEQ